MINIGVKALFKSNLCLSLRGYNYFYYLIRYVLLYQDVLFWLIVKTCYFCHHVICVLLSQTLPLVSSRIDSVTLIYGSFISPIEHCEIRLITKLPLLKPFPLCLVELTPLEGSAIWYDILDYSECLSGARLSESSGILLKANGI